MVAAVIPKERYGTTWELIIRMIVIPMIIQTNIWIYTKAFFKTMTHD
jgi:hypothetical protein